MMEDQAGVDWMNKLPRCLILVSSVKHIKLNPQVYPAILSGKRKNFFFFFLWDQFRFTY